MFTKGQVERMMAALMGARITLINQLISNTEVITETYFLTVSPNPASQEISINYTDVQQPVLPFQLMNIQGIVVEAGVLREENKSISVAHLPRGMYWLRCNTPKGRITRKLLLL